MKNLSPALLAVLLTGLLAAPVQADVDVFDVTLRARSCWANGIGMQECTIDLGELKLDFAGVGTDSAGVLITKADWDAYGFYLKYGPLHGCFIVQHPKGGFSMAFINPTTANVFSTYDKCKQDAQ